MSWSYSGNPASSPTDEVRFLVGDTDKATPLLQDEEIDYTIGVRGSPLGAAAELARALSAKFARLVDSSVDSTRFSFSQRTKAYADLATALEARVASLEGVMPICGGISRADKEVAVQDSDRITPFFRRGMDDDRWGGASGDCDLWNGRS